MMPSVRAGHPRPEVPSYGIQAEETALRSYLNGIGEEYWTRAKERCLRYDLDTTEQSRQQQETFGTGSRIPDRLLGGQNAQRLHSVRSSVSFLRRAASAQHSCHVKRAGRGIADPSAATAVPIAPAVRFLTNWRKSCLDLHKKIQSLVDRCGAEALEERWKALYSVKALLKSVLVLPPYPALLATAVVASASSAVAPDTAPPAAAKLSLFVKVPSQRQALHEGRKAREPVRAVQRHAVRGYRGMRRSWSVATATGARKRRQQQGERDYRDVPTAADAARATLESGTSVVRRNNFRKALSAAKLHRSLSAGGCSNNARARLQKEGQWHQHPQQKQQLQQLLAEADVARHLYESSRAAGVITFYETLVETCLQLHQLQEARALAAEFLCVPSFWPPSCTATLPVELQRLQLRRTRNIGCSDSSNDHNRQQATAGDRSGHVCSRTGDNNSSGSSHEKNSDSSVGNAGAKEPGVIFQEELAQCQSTAISKAAAAGAQQQKGSLLHAYYLLPFLQRHHLGGCSCCGVLHHIFGRKLPGSSNVTASSSSTPCPRSSSSRPACYDLKFTRSFEWSYTSSVSKLLPLDVWLVWLRAVAGASSFSHLLSVFAAAPAAAVLSVLGSLYSLPTPLGEGEAVLRPVTFSSLQRLRCGAPLSSPASCSSSCILPCGADAGAGFCSSAVLYGPLLLLLAPLLSSVRSYEGGGRETRNRDVDAVRRRFAEQPRVALKYAHTAFLLLPLQRQLLYIEAIAVVGYLHQRVYSTTAAAAFYELLLHLASLLLPQREAQERREQADQPQQQHSHHRLYPADPTACVAAAGAAAAAAASYFLPLIRNTRISAHTPTQNENCRVSRNCPYCPTAARVLHGLSQTSSAVGDDYDASHSAAAPAAGSPVFTTISPRAPAKPAVTAAILSLHSAAGATAAAVNTSAAPVAGALVSRGRPEDEGTARSCVLQQQRENCTSCSFFSSSSGACLCQPCLRQQHQRVQLRFTLQTTASTAASPPESSQTAGVATGKGWMQRLRCVVEFAEVQSQLLRLPAILCPVLTFRNPGGCAVKSEAERKGPRAATAGMNAGAHHQKEQELLKRAFSWPLHHGQPSQSKSSAQQQLQPKKEEQRPESQPKSQERAKKQREEYPQKVQGGQQQPQREKRQQQKQDHAQQLQHCCTKAAAEDEEQILQEQSEVGRDALLPAAPTAELQEECLQIVSCINSDRNSGRPSSRKSSSGSRDYCSSGTDCNYSSRKTNGNKKPRSSSHQCINSSKPCNSCGSNHQCGSDSKNSKCGTSAMFAAGQHPHRVAEEDDNIAERFSSLNLCTGISSICSPSSSSSPFVSGAAATAGATRGATEVLNWARALRQPEEQPVPPCLWMNRRRTNRKNSTVAFFHSGATASGPAAGAAAHAAACSSVFSPAAAPAASLRFPAAAGEEGGEAFFSSPGSSSTSLFEEWAQPAAVVWGGSTDGADKQRQRLLLQRRLLLLALHLLFERQGVLSSSSTRSRLAAAYQLQQQAVVLQQLCALEKAAGTVRSLKKNKLAAASKRGMGGRNICATQKLHVVGQHREGDREKEYGATGEAAAAPPRLRQRYTKKKNKIEKVNGRPTVAAAVQEGGSRRAATAGGGTATTYMRSIRKALSAPFVRDVQYESSALSREAEAAPAAVDKETSAASETNAVAAASEAAPLRDPWEQRSNGEGDAGAEATDAVGTEAAAGGVATGGDNRVGQATVGEEAAAAVAEGVRDIRTEKRFPSKRWRWVCIDTMSGRSRRAAAFHLFKRKRKMKRHIQQKHQREHDDNGMGRDPAAASVAIVSRGQSVGDAALYSNSKERSSSSSKWLSVAVTTAQQRLFTCSCLLLGYLPASLFATAAAAASAETHAAGLREELQQYRPLPFLQRRRLRLSLLRTWRGADSGKSSNSCSKGSASSEQHELQDLQQLGDPTAFCAAALLHAFEKYEKDSGSVDKKKQQTQGSSQSESHRNTSSRREKKRRDGGGRVLWRRRKSVADSAAGKGKKGGDSLVNAAAAAAAAVAGAAAALSVGPGAAALAAAAAAASGCCAGAAAAVLADDIAASNELTQQQQQREEEEDEQQLQAVSHKIGQKKKQVGSEEEQQQEECSKRAGMRHWEQWTRPLQSAAAAAEAACCVCERSRRRNSGRKGNWRRSNSSIRRRCNSLSSNDDQQSSDGIVAGKEENRHKVGCSGTGRAAGGCVRRAAAADEGGSDTSSITNSAAAAHVRAGDGGAAVGSRELQQLLLLIEAGAALLLPLASFSVGHGERLFVLCSSSCKDGPEQFSSSSSHSSREGSDEKPLPLQGVRSNASVRGRLRRSSRSSSCSNLVEGYSGSSSVWERLRNRSGHLKRDDSSRTKSRKWTQRRRGSTSSSSGDGIRGTSSGGSNTKRQKRSKRIRSSRDSMKHCSSGRISSSNRKKRNRNERKRDSSLRMLIRDEAEPQQHLVVKEGLEENVFGGTGKGGVKMQQLMSLLEASFLLALCCSFVDEDVLLLLLERLAVGQLLQGRALSCLAALRQLTSRRAAAATAEREAHAAAGEGSAAAGGHSLVGASPVVAVPVAVPAVAGVGRFCFRLLQRMQPLVLLRHLQRPCAAAATAANTLQQQMDTIQNYVEKMKKKKKGLQQREEQRQQQQPQPQQRQLERCSFGESFCLTAAAGVSAAAVAASAAKVSTVAAEVRKAAATGRALSETTVKGEPAVPGTEAAAMSALQEEEAATVASKGEATAAAAAAAASRVESGTEGSRCVVGSGGEERAIALARRRGMQQVDDEEEDERQRVEEEAAAAKGMLLLLAESLLMQARQTKMYHLPVGLQPQSLTSRSGSDSSSSNDSSSKSSIPSSERDSCSSSTGKTCAAASFHAVASPASKSRVGKAGAEELGEGGGVLRNFALNRESEALIATYPGLVRRAFRCASAAAAVDGCCCCSDYRVWGLLAWIAAHAFDLPAAAAFARKALLLDRRDVRLWLLLAWCHSGRHDVGPPPPPPPQQQQQQRQQQRQGSERHEREAHQQQQTAQQHQQAAQQQHDAQQPWDGEEQQQQQDRQQEGQHNQQKQRQGQGEKHEQERREEEDEQQQQEVQVCEEGAAAAADWILFEDAAAAAGGKVLSAAAGCATQEQQQLLRRAAAVSPQQALCSHAPVPATDVLCEDAIALATQKAPPAEKDEEAGASLPHGATTAARPPAPAAVFTAAVAEAAARKSEEALLFRTALPFPAAAILLREQQLTEVNGSIPSSMPRSSAFNAAAAEDRALLEENGGVPAAPSAATAQSHVGTAAAEPNPPSFFFAAEAASGAGEVATENDLLSARCHVVAAGAATFLNVIDAGLSEHPTSLSLLLGKVITLARFSPVFSWFSSAEQRSSAPPLPAAAASAAAFACAGALSVACRSPGRRSVAYCRKSCCRRTCCGGRCSCNSSRSGCRPHFPDEVVGHLFSPFFGENDTTDSEHYSSSSSCCLSSSHGSSSDSSSRSRGSEASTSTSRSSSSGRSYSSLDSCNSNSKESLYVRKDRTTLQQQCSQRLVPAAAAAYPSTLPGSSSAPAAASSPAAGARAALVDSAASTSRAVASAAVGAACEKIEPGHRGGGATEAKGGSSTNRKQFNAARRRRKNGRTGRRCNARLRLPCEILLLEATKQLHSLSSAAAASSSGGLFYLQQLLLLLPCAAQFLQQLCCDLLLLFPHTLSPVDTAACKQKKNGQQQQQPQDVQQQELQGKEAEECTERRNSASRFKDRSKNGHSVFSCSAAAAAEEAAAAALAAAATPVVCLLHGCAFKQQQQQQEYGGPWCTDATAAAHSDRSPPRAAAGVLAAAVTSLSFLPSRDATASAMYPLAPAVGAADGPSISPDAVSSSLSSSSSSSLSSSYPCCLRPAATSSPPSPLGGAAAAAVVDWRCLEREAAAWLHTAELLCHLSVHSDAAAAALNIAALYICCMRAVAGAADERGCEASTLKEAAARSCSSAPILADAAAAEEKRKKIKKKASKEEAAQEQLQQKLKACRSGAGGSSRDISRNRVKLSPVAAANKDDAAAGNAAADAGRQQQQQQSERQQSPFYPSAGTATESAAAASGKDSESIATVAGRQKGPRDSEAGEIGRATAAGAPAGAATAAEGGGRGDRGQARRSATLISKAAAAAWDSYGVATAAEAAADAETREGRAGEGGEERSAAEGRGKEQQQGIRQPSEKLLQPRTSLHRAGSSPAFFLSRNDTPAPASSNPTQAAAAAAAKETAAAVEEEETATAIEKGRRAEEEEAAAVPGERATPAADDVAAGGGGGVRRRSRCSLLRRGSATALLQVRRPRQQGQRRQGQQQQLICMRGNAAAASGNRRRRLGAHCRTSSSFERRSRNSSKAQETEATPSGAAETSDNSPFRERRTRRQRGVAASTMLSAAAGAVGTCGEATAAAAAAAAVSSSPFSLPGDAALAAAIESNTTCTVLPPAAAAPYPAAHCCHSPAAGACATAEETFSRADSNREGGGWRPAEQLCMRLEFVQMYVEYFFIHEEEEAKGGGCRGVRAARKVRGKRAGAAAASSSLPRLLRCSFKICKKKKTHPRTPLGSWPPAVTLDGNAAAAAGAAAASDDAAAAVSGDAAAAFLNAKDSFTAATGQEGKRQPQQQQHWQQAYGGVKHLLVSLLPSLSQLFGYAAGGGTSAAASPAPHEEEDRPAAAAVHPATDFSSPSSSFSSSSSPSCSCAYSSSLASCATGLPSPVAAEAATEEEQRTAQPVESAARENADAGGTRKATGAARREATTKTAAPDDTAVATGRAGWVERCSSRTPGAAAAAEGEEQEYAVVSTAGRGEGRGGRRRRGRRVGEGEAGARTFSTAGGGEKGKARAAAVDTMETRLSCLLLRLQCFRQQHPFSRAALLLEGRVLHLQQQFGAAAALLRVCEGGGYPALNRQREQQQQQQELVDLSRQGAGGETGDEAELCLDAETDLQQEAAAAYIRGLCLQQLGSDAAAAAAFLRAAHFFFLAPAMPASLLQHEQIRGSASSLLAGPSAAEYY